MSEFDEAMAEALGEAIEFIGHTDFFIGGRKYSGDLSELGQEAFIVVVGGKETVVTATLIAPLGQFHGTLPADLTRLKVGTRWFVVASRSTDTISVHFQLADADAH